MVPLIISGTLRLHIVILFGGTIVFFSKYAGADENGENSSSKAFGISFADRPKAKISRRERVDKNLQDISAHMQQMGQVLTAAGSALFKSMKPDRKYW
jgi:hypothetical protein